MALSVFLSLDFYILGVMLSLAVIPAVLFLIEEKSTRFQHQVETALILWKHNQFPANAHWNISICFLDWESSMGSYSLYDCGCIHSGFQIQTLQKTSEWIQEF